MLKQRDALGGGNSFSAGSGRGRGAATAAAAAAGRQRHWTRRRHCGESRRCWGWKLRDTATAARRRGVFAVSFAAFSPAAACAAFTTGTSLSTLSAVASPAGALRSAASWQRRVVPPEWSLIGRKCFFVSCSTFLAVFRVPRGGPVGGGPVSAFLCCCAPPFRVCCSFLLAAAAGVA